MNSRLLIAALLSCLILPYLTLKAQHKEIDSLKQVLSRMPDDTNKVKTMRLLFIAAIDSLNANEALPIALAQLTLAKKLHYEKGQAIACRLLSVDYETLGNTEKAMTAALTSLKLYEKLRDNAGTAASYSNIGLIYLDENETDEALAYFKKSLYLYSKFRNKPENIWRGYMNIGRVYEKLHNDSLALNSYLQSLVVSKSINQNQNVYVATSQFHVGSIYFDKKDYEGSNRQLTAALKSLSGAQEAYPASEIYLLLSKIYVVQHRLDKALKSAQTGLAIVKKVNYKTGLAEGYLQTSKVYASLKSYDNAYHFQTLYMMLKDSLSNVENVKKIEKLQFNYQLEKKEDINSGLLKDKKLEESKINLQKITIQRQYIGGGLIALCLLLFITISVFYYRSFKAKKRDHELLNLQQQEILEQNQEIVAQNEEISKQKEHLTELNDTKNKLFSIISHDLRSPVSTLQEALTLFNNEFLTSDEMEVLSAEMLTNVTNTSAMLDNVLYWAKSQMEGIHIDKKIFNIQKAITINLLNFKKQAASKKIFLVNKVDHAIKVLADPSSIDLILRNLVSNAIKFCEAGDTITCSSLINDRFLQVSVADTGKGMSKEVQERLFKPTEFYTTYGTANEKGTGLGLNLCREFVVLNGGNIWVESEEGSGSTFTFTVPLA